MRIALFVTCLADTMFPAAAQATVRLLERLGHEVVFPAEQTCCGQMHINTGYQRQAVRLVEHHVKTFEGYEAIVAPSGSCVGSIRHQHATVARAASPSSPADRATIACWCRTDPTHEPEGATTTSYGAKVLTCRRTSGNASFW